MSRLIDDQGRATPAHPVAIDQESGFALLQALGDLKLPAMPLGASAAVGVGEPVVMAGGGGARRHACRARVVAKQEFSGYWEYHIEGRAVHRAGASAVGRRWADRAGRAADRRRLAACAAERRARPHPRRQHERADRPADAGARRTPDATAGATSRRGRGSASTPPRAAAGWLIADAAEVGPAALAGLRSGDIISSVRDASIETLADFYREIWSCGAAGNGNPNRDRARPP